MKKKLLLFVITLLSITIKSGIFAMKNVQSINQKILKELDTLPNQPVLYSILEKRNLGGYFSNNPEKYIVVKSNAQYAFLAGELEETDLQDVLAFLQSYENITLICNEQYHSWFLKNSYKLCPRIEFLYTAKTIELLPIQSNFVLKNIDHEIFTRCMWYTFITNLYGSPERFLNNGFGVALCDNNTIASEAYAACIGKGFCEVGITTHTNYRGQGLATQTAGQLVKQCLDRNLVPMWSCDYENPASWKVALKLGFTVNRYYAFLKK